MAFKKKKGGEGGRSVQFHPIKYFCLTEFVKMICTLIFNMASKSCGEEMTEERGI